MSAVCPICRSAHSPHCTLKPRGESKKLKALKKELAETRACLADLREGKTGAVLWSASYEPRDSEWEAPNELILRASSSAAALELIRGEIDSMHVDGCDDHQVFDVRLVRVDDSAPGFCRFPDDAIEHSFEFHEENAVDEDGFPLSELAAD